MRREIIEIDMVRCNGCGDCIPNCPEGALQVIDGKARLVSDLFCDGLGACVGHCPKDAIKVVIKEAVSYDEKKVMENIVRQGTNTIRAHLIHLRDHGAAGYLEEAVGFLKEEGYDIPDLEENCGCSSAQERTISKNREGRLALASALEDWPIQLKLVPVNATFLREAELLIAADCTAFSCGAFHSELLMGKKLLIGCPKFDDLSSYEEKLSKIFEINDIKNATVAIMEVPCCDGLYRVVEKAIERSGKEVLLYRKIIYLDGSIHDPASKRL